MVNQDALFDQIDTIMTQWNNCQITKVEAKKQVVQTVKGFNEAEQSGKKKKGIEKD